MKKRVNFDQKNLDENQEYFKKTTFTKIDEIKTPKIRNYSYEDHENCEDDSDPEK